MNISRRNQRQGRGWRTEEEQASGVTVCLARAMRLAGDSRPADVGGYQ